MISSEIDCDDKNYSELIIYQNSQWKIVDERSRPVKIKDLENGTSYYPYNERAIVVQQVNGSYWFESIELFELPGKRNIIDQLSSKDWVDPQDLMDVCKRSKDLMVIEYPYLSDKPSFDLFGAIQNYNWGSHERERI